MKKTLSILSLCLGAALAVAPVAAQEGGASADGLSAAFKLGGGTLQYQIIVGGNANGATLNGVNLGASFQGGSYAAGTVAYAGDLDGANLVIQGGPSATVVQTAESDDPVEPPDTSPCGEGLGCVQDDRFEITVSAVANGETVMGVANDLTGDTDWFSFFDPSNVEVFVKVPSGTCGINNRWWIFAGGATDLDLTVRVRDTQTGLVQTYTSTGTFTAINDTSAFESCPQ